jgi:hypothetical protein
MRQAAGPVAILLGLVLLAISHFAGASGSERYWTDEDQQTYQAAQLEYHKLAHAPAPPPGKARRKGATLDDLETARQRFEVEHRRLQAARGAQRGTGRAFFWAGLAFIALGIGASLMQRRA